MNPRVSPLKVAVLNNYSLLRVHREVTAGRKPDHHLYGTNRLSAYGFEVEIVPLDERCKAPLAVLTAWLRRSRFPVPDRKSVV
jgi:hypothetical protein